MLYKSAQILLICPVEKKTNYILFIFNALVNFLQLETHGHAGHVYVKRYMSVYLLYVEWLNNCLQFIVCPHLLLVLIT